RPSDRRCRPARAVRPRSPCRRRRRGPRHRVAAAGRVSRRLSLNESERMRITIPTGTDVAAVAAGDPTLLQDLGSLQGREFHRRCSEAVAAHALWRAETGADGAYLVHLYVNEEPAAEIRPYLVNPIVVDPFHVPSGRLMVAGEEALTRVGLLTKYPHMGRE